MSLSKEQLIEEQQQLIERQTALKARLEAIEQDYRRGLDKDAEEQALQLENAEVLDGIAAAVAGELEQVEERLARVNAAFEQLGN